LALDLIRGLVAYPVVGVVPAIKPAAALSKARVIGLLATPATINRRYTTDLINEFAGDCHVARVGSDLLVRLAEEHLRGGRIDVSAVAREIAPLFDGPTGPLSTDVVVLGCTHFPLLIEALNAAVPRPVVFLEPAEAICKRATAVLQQKGFVPPKQSGIHRWFFTRSSVDERLLASLRVWGFEDVAAIDV